MNSVLWIHEDALTIPERCENLSAVFVFDPVWIKEDGWSLKRLMFVYECLLELPVEIRKGDTLTEVLDFARGESILAVNSPNPRIRSVIEQLEARVHVVEPEPFVKAAGPFDLRRFARYWRKIEGAVVETD